MRGRKVVRQMRWRDSALTSGSLTCRPQRRPSVAPISFAHAANLSRLTAHVEPSRGHPPPCPRRCPSLEERSVRLGACHLKHDAQGMRCGLAGLGWAVCTLRTF